MITPRPPTQSSLSNHQQLQNMLVPQPQSQPQRQRMVSCSQHIQEVPNPYYRPNQPLQQTQNIQPTVNRSHNSNTINRTLPTFYKQPQTYAFDSSFTERQHLQPSHPSEQRYKVAVDQINQLTMINTKLQQSLENRQKNSVEIQRDPQKFATLELVNQELRVANLSYIKKLQEMERRTGGVRATPQHIPTQPHPVRTNQNTPPPHNQRLELSSASQSDKYTPSSRKRSVTHSSQQEVSPFILGQMPDMKDVQYIAQLQPQHYQQWYVKMDRQIVGLRELLADRNSEKRRLETLLEQSKAQEILLNRKAMGLEALVDLLNSRNKQQESTINNNDMTIRSMSCRRAPVSRLRELENFKHKFDELSQKSEKVYSQTKILEDRLRQSKETVSRLQELLEESSQRLSQKDKAMKNELQVYRENEKTMLGRLQTLTDQLMNRHAEFAQELYSLRNQTEETESNRIVELLAKNNNLESTIIALENNLTKLQLQNNLRGKEHRTIQEVEESYRPDLMVTPEKSQQRRLQPLLSTIQEQLSNQPNLSADNSVHKSPNRDADSPSKRDQEYDRLRNEKIQLEENFQRIQGEKHEWEQMYKVLRTSYLKLKGENPDKQIQSSGSEGFSELTDRSAQVSWEKYEQLMRQLDQLKFKYSLDINHIKRERDNCLAELASVTAELDQLRSQISEVSEPEQLHSANM